tara:strand:- start:126 stop:644 length:519 start_codon:yes stop_codon:yes gene_type:complete
MINFAPINSFAIGMWPTFGVQHYATATMTATGAMTASGHVLAYGSGSMAAVGSVSAQGYASKFGAGSMSGHGTFNAVVSKHAYGSGSMAGVGNVNAHGYASKFGSGSMTGEGTFAPVWVLVNAHNPAPNHRQNTINEELRALNMKSCQRQITIEKDDRNIDLNLKGQSNGNF